MKKIKLGLVGASGKMGIAIRNIMAQSKNFSGLIAVSSQNCADFNLTVNSLANVDPKVLKQVDVWIDFSTAEQFKNILKYTGSAPIVSGTTDFSTSELKNLKKFGKTRPFFWASNMSLGIWTLRQALKSLALIPDFEFKVEEVHHTQKKDNPSGTAKTLHRDLEKIVGKKVSLPLGKRIGDVFGEHEVTATSKSEVLTFKHTALNREVFAEGALKAAKWIVNKKKGYYSMEDL